MTLQHSVLNDVAEKQLGRRAELFVPATPWLLPASFQVSVWCPSLTCRWNPDERLTPCRIVLLQLPGRVGSICDQKTCSWISKRHCFASTFSLPVLLQAHSNILEIIFAYSIYCLSFCQKFTNYYAGSKCRTAGHQLRHKIWEATLKRRY